MVVVTDHAGNATSAPLKAWLRSNPDHFPLGMDSSNTSHQLRGALKNDGWRLELTDEQALLIPPTGDFDAVERFVSDLDEQSEQSEYDEELSFELESQLRDFIASNLGSIQVNGSRLKLFRDENERSGVEYPTGVGPIDILAEDEHGNLFVFELKRATSPDRAIGQVKRYMGWLRHHYNGKRDVNGVIVAKSVSENLRYATAMVPNIWLYEYSVSFSLAPILPIS